jgi:hypothetical protein
MALVALGLLLSSSMASEVGSTTSSILRLLASGRTSSITGNLAFARPPQAGGSARVLFPQRTMACVRNRRGIAWRVFSCVRESPLDHDIVVIQSGASRTRNL